MTEYAQLIVNHIKSTLTGDYEKDMLLLHSAGEKYKNDEDSADILHAIAEMMYGLLPDNQKQELRSQMQKIKDQEKEEFEKAKKMIESGAPAEAAKVLKNLIEMTQGRFEEDEENVYFSFHHIMEWYLYSYYYKPVKEVKTIDVPISEYYNTYGYALAQTENYEKARRAYQASLKWNPVDIDTLFSLCEIYKFENNLEQFLKTTEQAYRYACTRATMARYYRNIAYYYLETYKPEIARAIYVYSDIYYPTENTKRELVYIEKAINQKTPDYHFKELQEILKENDIKPGPDSVTIGIIYRVGQLMLEEGETQLAKDCFTIVYDITQDEEAKAVLNKL